MAIKIYTGNTFSVVSNEVINEIKTNTSTFVKQILIVPDQFTLSYEKEVLTRLNLKCSFDIEVMSFSRFAQKVLGKSTLKMLNQQTSVLLLKSIIIKNLDKLMCFKSVANTAGYANEMYAVITNIRNSGITTEEIEKVLPNLKGAVAEKTKDILTLYKEYLKELNGKFVDMGSVLDELALIIPSIDWIRSTCFYITDFHMISKVKLNIVKQLFKNALNVTMGVVNTDGTSNFRIYPRFLIDFAQVTAKEAGQYVEIKEFYEQLKPKCKIIQEKLFGFNMNVYDTPKSDDFEMYYAEDIELEVKNVASKIRQMVVEYGKRYKDIQIVCSDIIEYKEYFKRIFKDFEIPFYLDESIELSKTYVIKLLSVAAKTIESELSLYDMLDFAKNCDLFIDKPDICEFENYCLKYNINHTRFLSKFTLEDAYLKKAEAVRAKLVDALFVLSKKTDTVENGVVNIIEFFKKVDLSMQLDKLSKISGGLGEDVVAQIGGKIDTACSQAILIMGDMKMNNHEVLNMMLAMFESISISTIPLFIDSVFIGKGTESRYENCKVMFVLGANDNKYPTDSSDFGILASRECEAWEKQGVKIFPQIKEKSLLDKFFILQMLLKAKEKVIISYPISRGEEPSLLMTSICQLLMLDILPMNSFTNTKLLDSHGYAIKIGTKANAINEILNFYGEIESNWLEGDLGVFDYLFSVINKNELQTALKRTAKIENVEPNKLSFSVSDEKVFAKVSAIETYFKCPFSFFMQYTLKVEERKEGKEEVVDVGKFLHRVLELYFKDNKQVLQNVEIEKKVNSICSKVFCEKEYIMLLKSGNEMVIKENLKKRAVFLIKNLVENLKKSEFEPTYTELKFGMQGSELPAIELNVLGQKYFMRGVIDRVDICNDNAALVDYKSSSKVDFTISELYYGLRVQLFLYSSVLEKLNLKTSGLFYLPIPYKYISEKEEKVRYKYSGFVTCDEDVLNKLDKEFLAENGSFLPVALNRKTGELKADCPNILSQQQFNEYKNYAKLVIANAIGDIESGYIAPRPTKKACDYCGYGNICGISLTPQNKRETPKIGGNDKNGVE